MTLKIIGMQKINLNGEKKFSLIYMKKLLEEKKIYPKEFYVIKLNTSLINL